MATDMLRFPPGVPYKLHRGFHSDPEYTTQYGRATSEPESATQSRERRRVALVIRELSTHFDTKFDELAAKIDVATAGLVAIANRELAALMTNMNQPDAELSPDRVSQQVCPVHDTGLQPTTLNFDLFARDDVVEIGIQTCGEWEPFVLDPNVQLCAYTNSQHEHSSFNQRKQY